MDGGLATEVDVGEGRAVFFLGNVGKASARPSTMRLPALALWPDPDRGNRRPVVFVNGMFAGLAPRLVPVPRDHTIKIRCSLDGYRDETTNVYREIAPAAAWDSPVFAVLDEMSGSAYRLQRKTLFVELTPVAALGAGKMSP